MVDPSTAPRLVPPFGPLEGITVLDSGRFVAGPWASTYLGEFGAQVIHVEGPPFDYPYADPARTLPPLLPVNAPPEDAVSESWVQYSRNKLSVGLDVRTARGREIFLELARRSDVWIESSRPGTYARLGLADETVSAVNPALTIVHVSGFGQTGETKWIGRPSFDLIGQAYSGYLSLQGRPDPEPPTRSGTALNDTVTGLAAATAALMGVTHSRRTGRGQSIDVAQYEVFFVLLENLALDFFVRGVVRARQGSAHARVHPYDVHRARDGWVVVAAPTRESLRALMRLLAVTDPRWEETEWRLGHRAEVDEVIARFCQARTVAELEAVAQPAGVAISRVYDMRSIAADAHYAERGMFVTWDDPVAGRVKGAGVAPRFSSTPGGVWRGAPWLGQDNDRVLTSWLGLAAGEIEELRRQSVIGEHPPRLRPSGSDPAPRGAALA